MACCVTKHCVLAPFRGKPINSTSMSHAGCLVPATTSEEDFDRDGLNGSSLVRNRPLWHSGLLKYGIWIPNVEIRCGSGRSSALCFVVHVATTGVIICVGNILSNQSLSCSFSTNNTLLVY